MMYSGPHCRRGSGGGGGGAGAGAGAAGTLAPCTQRRGLCQQLGCEYKAESLLPGRHGWVTREVALLQTA